MVRAYTYLLNIHMYVSYICTLLFYHAGYSTTGKSNDSTPYKHNNGYTIIAQYSPVFPEVGSINVSPGLSVPSFSASCTIHSPILSFTNPPALKNSHLATGELHNSIKEWKVHKWPHH